MNAATQWITKSPNLSPSFIFQAQVTAKVGELCKELFCSALGNIYGIILILTNIVVALLFKTIDDHNNCTIIMTNCVLFGRRKVCNSNVWLK